MNLSFDQAQQLPSDMARARQINEAVELLRQHGVLRYFQADHLESELALIRRNDPAGFDSMVYADMARKITIELLANGALVKKREAQTIAGGHFQRYSVRAGLLYPNGRMFP